MDENIIADAQRFRYILDLLNEGTPYSTMQLPFAVTFNGHVLIQGNGRNWREAIDDCMRSRSNTNLRIMQVKTHIQNLIDVLQTLQDNPAGTPADLDGNAEEATRRLARSTETAAR